MKLVDWAVDHTRGMIALGLIATVILLILIGKYEHDYPCLVRGPREIAYWQRRGDALIPVYHHPCLERATPPVSEQKCPSGIPSAGSLGALNPPPPPVEMRV